MKYIILAKGEHEGFKVPRQLSIINGERLLDRTIRLLKENGIKSKDIIVTGTYKDLGDVVVYNPIDNSYNYDTNTGYWLDAFSQEFLVEPVCFIWGDVYFSAEAIKTIVETETDSTMFFCSYKNKSKNYIKRHDEPFAYKIVDTELFKKHVRIVKHLWDIGYCARNPIIWEVYRSIHNIDVNKHIMTKDYIAINDITCDIDSPQDILKIQMKVGFKMVRLEVIETPETVNGLGVSRFNEIKELVRANPQKNAEGVVYVGDKFLASKDLADYFLGNNKLEKAFVKVIEVIPEKKKKAEKEEVIEKKSQKRTRKAK